jgi:hypothetical protein
MLIDCDTCAVRGAACRARGGCLVSALFDAPREIAALTVDERQAIEAFARAGFEVEVLSEAPARAVPQVGPPRAQPGWRVA